NVNWPDSREPGQEEALASDCFQIGVDVSQDEPREHEEEGDTLVEHQPEGKAWVPKRPGMPINDGGSGEETYTSQGVEMRCLVYRRRAWRVLLKMNGLNLRVLQVRFPFPETNRESRGHFWSLEPMSPPDDLNHPVLVGSHTQFLR